MKNIKFIYFDIDDTLLDHKYAQKLALEELRVDSLILQDVSSQLLLETYARINSKLWVDYGKSIIDRHQLQRLRFELTLEELELETSLYGELGTSYSKAYEQHWNWITGAENCFNEISASYDVGLLTNGFSDTQQKKVKRFNLNKSSKHIVISEDVGFLKPDSRIFAYATDLTDLDPDQILYVGDSYTSDIKGGSMFGWKTAWFTKHSEAHNYNSADFIFNDFSQLQQLLTDV
ncbi:MAG: HAD family hydrolase [Balneolales bacterium]